MGHKHPGKITKKFVSVLAASAIMTTQIPANFPVNIANAESELPLTVGSLSDSNVINLTPEKNMDKNTVSSTSTTVSQTTSTTNAVTNPAKQSSTTSTFKAEEKTPKAEEAVLKTESSSTTTTTTTTTNATLSSSTTTTIPESEKIQPNPTLSMSKSVISASEAGKTVPVTIFINDDNFKNEGFYINSTVFVDFDGRLSFNGVQAGTEDGSVGMSAGYSNYNNNSYRRTYGINVYPSGSNIGKNGTYATINVTIPSDAQPGDIYYFNIFTNNNQKHYFNYSNSKVKSEYDRYACQTADTSDDKYLKDTPFGGYILIDPESQASSAVTSSRQVVMKDLVYYNVYSDHAEVAYCDYEAENVEIASEINGKKVTNIASYAFYNSNVKTVSIPDTVKSIG